MSTYHYVPVTSAYRLRSAETIMAPSVDAYTARRGYLYLATTSAMTRLWRGTDQPTRLPTCILEVVPEPPRLTSPLGASTSSPHDNPQGRSEITTTHQPSQRPGPNNTRGSRWSRRNRRDNPDIASVPRPFRLNASGRNKIHPSIHICILCLRP
jgi:hypothetical protein